jgi:GNAT superfamily N-acetyltransferase
MAELLIRDVGYDHPDAARLVAEVQAEYVIRYGGPDETPVQVEEFAHPNGLFAVGYLDGVAVATGAWRLLAAGDPSTDWAAPAVEVKRMYVTPAARGAGFARGMLAFLELQAERHGARWVLLETGLRQPEAIALYRSAGYQDVRPFGHYAEAELSVHLGKRLG